jgi:hypothetical protein
MTPIVLLEQLRDFTREQIKDIILPVRPVSNKMTEEYAKSVAVDCNDRRPPEVHLMQLPSKDAATNRIPYIVLQALKGDDSRQAGENPHSDCKVRVVAMTYNENVSEGLMSALNVVTRLRIALLRAGQVGQFLLKPGTQWIVYETEIDPYYVGEMMMTFEMPEIYRETNIIGGNYGET